LEETLAQTGMSTAAEQVAALAARHAAGAETDRRLHPEVVEALVAAGFARHFVPAGHGGAAATFAELMPAVTTVGRACASTAWCASLAANVARMAAFLPAEGQQEIWADGPDALVVGGLVPIGRPEPVDGGWRLSGQWPYMSLVERSDWALLCGMVPTSGEPLAKIFALPRRDYEFLDTWFNVGMRATGSNTLVVDDVFVPAARTFDRDSLFAGRAVGTTAPCHAVPLHAVNGLSLAVPALGAARGAQDSWSAYIAEKVRRVSPAPGGPGLSRISFDMALARSAGELDAVQLLLERASAVADQGATITRLATQQNLRDAALAADMVVTAVDRLFRAAGTTGQAAANPIQRFWRDVSSIATHVALQFEPAAHAYAKELFGG
jgi:two-component flavin-dependent monooxygenase/oxygenase LndZ5